MDKCNEVLLARGHATLCGFCDREQKLLYYPEGHDGCVCYREYYKQQWLCQRCDVQNSINVGGDIAYFTSRRRKLRQVGNQMRVMPVDQGPANLPRWLSWCPCGRQLSESAPPSIQNVPSPWPGNHNLIASTLDRDTGRRRPTIKHCVLCCGYIVPRVPIARPPTRGSARLADRKSGRQNARQHTMLDRSGKAATRHLIARGLKFVDEAVGDEYRTFFLFQLVSLFRSNRRYWTCARFKIILCSQFPTSI